MIDDIPGSQTVKGRGRVGQLGYISIHSMLSRTLHRLYELTTSGVQDFIAYLDGLEANGTNTAIIDTLELVLDTVPQIAISDGRIARRQYILLTDGEEMVRRDWVDQKLLEKLLRKWGKELKVESRDSLFLLRVGDMKGSYAEKSFVELKRQAEKVKRGGGCTC